MRSNFLSVFVSKAVSWLMIIFCLCSSFLVLTMSTQAAQRNSGGERYAADNSLFGQADNGASASLDGYGTPVMTRGYVLVSGDTLDSVAKRYNLSVEGLRRLNQDRFFKNGFDQVKAGDIVYVPVAPVSDEMARYLEGDASQNGAITSLATQASNFLSNGGHSSELQSMATGYFAGKANSEINRWFNQFGTSRIQLNVDDGFSLKNSQFEMLLPVYDKGNSLAFTQTSIHRTDDRTQSNLGFGYRYFTQNYMLGGNAFWDYDISRSHSRMGVGVEYWRDYLKLGMNAYYRLSDWRTSHDVDDYYERPANGWDIRAEGYLPSYPKLGMKLNFEQYYGNEVGLFGKNERQKNPYAVTFGANYTPVPLVTFNVDHRQGASGKDDTRLGFQVNYRFGVPLSKQLDPDAVGDMRTLAGSRYDLVDRNNNIVLEYKKKEFINLYMVGGITGFYNESYSLGITVKSKYEVASVNVMAAALIAAGGKIVQGSGVNDYSVVLPPYQWGGNNSYVVNAVATDVKGNTSKEATTTVTVKAPGFDDANSTFTASPTSIVANNIETSTLTFTAKDTNGNPITGIKDKLVFDVVIKGGSAPESGKVTVSAIAETESGVYTATLKGTIANVYTITPKFNNKAVGNLSAEVTLTGNIELVLAWENGITSATVDEQPTFSVVVRDRDSGTLVPNKTVTFTLSSNGGGKPSIYPSTVTSGTDGTITQAPAVSDHKAETVTVTGQISGTNVTASLSIPFIAGEMNANASTIKADPDSILANGSTTSKIIYEPKDRYGNPITSIDASIIESVIIGIDDSGIKIDSWSLVDNHYEAILTSGHKTGDIKVIPVINGKDGIARTTNNILNLYAGDIDASQGEIKAIPNEIVANGKSTSRIEFRPRDAAGNFIATLDTTKIGQKITAQEVDGPLDMKMSAWSYDRGAGAYVSTLTSGTTKGVINIMPTVNGVDAATIGVTRTLKLVENSGSNINIAIANTDTAIADGVETNTIIITLTDDSGTALPDKNVTVIPSNSELSINGTLGSVDFTTDAEGKVSLRMASTFASWLGSNGFTVNSGGFSAQGQTSFSLYVDQDTSLVSLDKDILYNDGIDQLTATYKPLDKKGRAIPADQLNVTFSTTDLDPTQVIKQNGYTAKVSTQNKSPSDYYLSATMINYNHGWQPKPVKYTLAPIKGVLLAILEVTPKLCGAIDNNNVSCTPNDTVDYRSSGLGFVIKLAYANPLWDKVLYLSSSNVSGNLTVTNKEGTQSQNCSISVSELNSWMNDFGSQYTNDEVGTLNYALLMNFTKYNSFDTYSLGQKSRGGTKSPPGGGIGLCDVKDFSPLNPHLTGSGNIDFEVRTYNPLSFSKFSVPLTGMRIDVGELSTVIRVPIYAS